VNIKILGTGCTKCLALEKGTREAVQELGIEAGIEKVTDMRQIMQYNILSTPGLVINEKLVCNGHVLNKAEIKSLIASALAGK
jgi:small redox-active disulfide protein 2